MTGKGAVLVMLLLAVLGGCDRMANQPKRAAYAPAEDSQPHPRQPPPGTIALDEKPAAPPPVTAALLERGQQRFDIYCSPCHSRVGDGNGMIVQRGFPHPPSYFIQRLLDAPTQHFVDVIAHGYGVMFPYASRVAPSDRWAIAAYIRALQASQTATLDDVPTSQRNALQ